MGNIERYNELYDNMVSSKDVEKMSIFGCAEKWVFPQVAQAMPKLAQKWLDKLEATMWYNYLSEDEANEIVAGLVNQNGTKGGQWSSFAAFSQMVEQMDLHLECKPYYNAYALWATANMLYSDHAVSTAEFVQEKDFPKFMCKQAVEKLKDGDRPRFVREYFHV